MPYVPMMTPQQAQAGYADIAAHDSQRKLIDYKLQEAQSENGRMQKLRDLYASGNVNPQSVGAIDPMQAEELRKTNYLQQDRNFDNSIKRHTALKEVMTRFKEQALQAGFDPSNPATQPILEQVGARFRPIVSEINGQPDSGEPIHWDSVVAVADHTPGEFLQQKLAERQSLNNLDLQSKQQQLEMGNQYDIAKQQQLLPMQLQNQKDIESYKADVMAQKDVSKQTNAAKVSLPKVIDEVSRSYALLDELNKSKGLESVVGVPGITGGLLAGKVIPGTDAANFMARLNQINGKAFLQDFESL